MIKIDKVVLPSAEQMDVVIRGMRNPMNSWDRIDSNFNYDFPDLYEMDSNNLLTDLLGDADKGLMLRLSKAGTDHRKFMRMMPVYVDITAPLYWWSEFDTYKIGTVANSCSKMHKLMERELTMDDFSHENLIDIDDTEIGEIAPKAVLQETIVTINYYINKFNETKDKKYWWQAIQLLPNSYNQTRTVMLNYEVLANIYHSRKNHKLDEWKDFCKWVESLPLSELITGEEKSK